MIGCCVSGSLSEEQKARLLQRFKVLCVAGLQNEGNSTDGNNESTLIRCNCCYNLPVDTEPHSKAPESSLKSSTCDVTSSSPSFSRPWWCFRTRLISCQSSTRPSTVFVVILRSAFDEVLQPVSTRSDYIQITSTKFIVYQPHQRNVRFVQRMALEEKTIKDHSHRRPNRCVLRFLLLNFKTAE